MLTRLPEFVTKQDVQQAIETVVFRKGLQLARDAEFLNDGREMCTNTAPGAI